MRQRQRCRNQPHGGDRDPGGTAWRDNLDVYLDPCLDLDLNLNLDLDLHLSLDLDLDIDST